MSLIAYTPLITDPVRVRVSSVAYPADVLVDELFEAVLRALGPEDPIAAAVGALPRPVPYMNFDPGYGRHVLGRAAINRWLHPLVAGCAERDAAFTEVLTAYESLDLDRLSRDDAEDAERWAQSCAALLRDPADRMLATQVALVVNGVAREDDSTVVEYAARALVAARGRQGFLLLRELCDTVHQLGFTDRVS